MFVYGVAKVDEYVMLSIRVDTAMDIAAFVALSVAIALRYLKRSVWLALGDHLSK